MLKLNGVSTDAIWLRLFPFSLKDKARAQLHSLPSGCITTWDKLTKSVSCEVLSSQQDDKFEKPDHYFRSKGGRIVI